MTEFDRRLCEEVADLWEANGGDADGMCFCVGDIVRILREREAKREEVDDGKVYEA